MGELGTGSAADVDHAGGRDICGYPLILAGTDNLQPTSRTAFDPRRPAPRVAQPFTRPDESFILHPRNLDTTTQIWNCHSEYVPREKHSRCTQGILKANRIVFT